MFDLWGRNDEYIRTVYNTSTLSSSIKGMHTDVGHRNRMLQVLWKLHFKNSDILGFLTFIDISG